MLGVSLFPGTGTTVTVQITSPIDLEPDLYSFSETLTNDADTSYSSTAAANYNVKIPDTTPPNVTITSPADGYSLPRKGSVKVSVSATDESGISRIEIYINNVSVKVCNNTGSCQYTWSMNAVPGGTYEIKATAVDKAPAANNNSVSITVTKAG